MDSGFVGPGKYIILGGGSSLRKIIFLLANFTKHIMM